MASGGEAPLAVAQPRPVATGIEPPSVEQASTVAPEATLQAPEAEFDQPSASAALAVEEALPVGDWTCGAVGDLTGDGAVDLVVGDADGDVRLLINDGSGHFRLAATGMCQLGALRALALLDFDGDHDADVLTAGTQLRLWRNDGRTEAGVRFTEQISWLDSRVPYVLGLAVGDIDGDLDVDIVLGDGTTLRNDDGCFRQVPSPLAAAGEGFFGAVALGDLDADGYLDVVVAERGDGRNSDGKNWVLRNRGDGTFVDATTDWYRGVPGPGSEALALVDLDGNGCLDLVGANRRRFGIYEATRSVVLYFRDGSLHHTPGDGRKRFTSDLAVAQSVATGDFDGDGTVDVVFGNKGPEVLYRNDGRGTLRSGPSLPAHDDDTRAIFMVDLDGDTRLEIVTLNHGGRLRCYKWQGHEAVKSDGNAADAAAAGRSGVETEPRPLAADKYENRKHVRAFLTRPSERPVRQAIDRALRYLRAQQGSDGSWRTVASTADGATLVAEPAALGPTGLALLCFLAEGSHLRGGVHGEAVARGVECVQRCQTDGGLFAGANGTCDIVDHAIATLAVAETCSMSRDPSLRESIERALEYMEATRNQDGGFGLAPGCGSEAAVTIWCALAQIAGQDAGVVLARSSVDATVSYLRNVTDATGHVCGCPIGDGRGLAEESACSMLCGDDGEALTAGALFTRVALGERPSDLRRLHERLAVALPQRTGHPLPHAWFQGAQALSQFGGPRWDEWRAALHHLLVVQQHGDGSWGCEVDGPGSVLATALATLALQAEYRYARMVDRRWWLAPTKER